MQTRRGITVTDNQAAVYDVLATYGPLPGRYADKHEAVV